jgi:hypothetical protein
MACGTKAIKAIKEKFWGSLCESIKQCRGATEEILPRACASEQPASCSNSAVNWRFVLQV